MFHKIRKKVQNAPLAQKFLILLLPGIFLFALFILAGFLLIIRSSNRMLYQTSGELLTYSSKDISRNLHTVQGMANFILEDNSIQTALSESKDGNGSNTPSNSYARVHAALNNYYQKYKSYYVDYVQVVTDKFSVLSSGIDSHVLPSELQSEILETARTQDGRLCWITHYCDTYGIFLVRSLRRIEHLKLDDLGVLIININIRQMMEDISAPNQSQDSVSYILCNGSQTLYAPASLKNYERFALEKVDLGEYSIQKICQDRYFTIRGRITDTGWDYFCLSPYEDMYKNIQFFQQLFIFILFSSLLLCILLTKVLMKPLVTHFDALMTKIKAFGNEKFEIIHCPYSYENRYDEIGLLHQQFDSMAAKILTLIKENYEHKLLAKESQLKALEMQINPHFLYNTLQSINWRAKLLKDVPISLMTESLGKLLRITLSRKNKDSSLSQELELVKYYMNIQEIRFEDSLRCETEIPPELVDTYLPKFTLQPLVENAIHYTLEEDSDECLIYIKAHRETECIVITVSNTESRFEENLLEKLISKEILPNGFGIGILNVYKRLELAFGDSCSLEFINEEMFATVKITVPDRTDAKRRDRYASIADC